MIKKFNQYKLQEIHQNETKGGQEAEADQGGGTVTCCTCGCRYRDCGGSSDIDNSMANNSLGINS